MELIVIFIIVLLLTWIWLNIIAIVAIKHDSTLDEFQKKAQIALVLLVPFLGVVLVLYLVNQHSPEAIPRGLVHWPFKSLVFGKQRPKYRNRDGNEESGIDLSTSRGQDRHFGSNGGSDGGKYKDRHSLIEY